MRGWRWTLLWMGNAWTWRGIAESLLDKPTPEVALALVFAPWLIFFTVLTVAWLANHRIRIERREIAK